MSGKYPFLCIGHKAAGTEGACQKPTGRISETGRRNPYWCPDCDEARIAQISAVFEKMSAALDKLEPPK